MPFITTFDLIGKAVFLALVFNSMLSAAPSEPDTLWVEPVTTYQLLVGPKTVGGYYRSPEAAWHAYAKWLDSDNDSHPEIQIVVGNFRPCQFGWQSRDSWNGQSGSYCHDFRRMEGGRVTDEGTSSLVARGYACPTDALLKVSRVAPMTLSVGCQLGSLIAQSTSGCCEEPSARAAAPHPVDVQPPHACYPSRYSYWDAYQARNVTQSFCFAYRTAPQHTGVGTSAQSPANK